MSTHPVAAPAASSPNPTTTALAPRKDGDAGVSPKHFFIFGQGISFSMSPTIHTAAYKAYNLPYTYEIRESPNIKEYEGLIKDPTFGGASVTMPHKLNIGVYCHEVSVDAQRIGAINTLIPQINTSKPNEVRIIGDNTDWAGLVDAIRRASPSIAKNAQAGLVIGAGGASRAALYALYQLGVKDVYICNRTQANAEAAAENFKDVFKVSVLPDLKAISTVPAPPSIIIGTIPADRTTQEQFPESLFAQPNGVCVDMAYKPRVTPLMLAATKAGFTTVNGLEVLMAQGCVQFQLWTELKAPEEQMRTALLKHEQEQAQL